MDVQFKVRRAESRGNGPRYRAVKGKQQDLEHGGRNLMAQSRKRPVLMQVAGAGTQRQQSEGTGNEVWW